MTVRIVSWNIGGAIEPWKVLADMRDVDVALLQEAGRPPAEVAERIDVDPAPWCTPGKDGDRSTWRVAVARLSDRVEVEWVEAKPLEGAASKEFAVSRPGTVAAARVTAPGVEPFLVVSMYSLWTRPHVSTGSSWIISDASAHRVVSDLSAFIGKQNGHRILAAGDLNILHGYGELGNKYWGARYGTVFTRMEALGLSFVGPQKPNGRQAAPWPKELPPDSKDVPTYYSNRQTPATATRQLDFVFASKGMADSVSVRAINEPEEWGPSDHCRLQIKVS